MYSNNNNNNRSKWVKCKELLLESKRERLSSLTALNMIISPCTHTKVFHVQDVCFRRLRHVTHTPWQSKAHALVAHMNICRCVRVAVRMWKYVFVAKSDSYALLACAEERMNVSCSYLCNMQHATCNMRYYGATKMLQNQNEEFKMQINGELRLNLSCYWSCSVSSLKLRMKWIL